MDYATQEASFERPPGLADASINRLVYKRPTGNLQIVVSRAPAQGKSLSELTAIRLRDQKRALPYFELADQAERQVANKPAADVALLYNEGERKAYQRSVSFLVDASLVLVAVHGPAGSRKELDEMFEQAIASLTFRQRGN